MNSESCVRALHGLSYKPLVPRKSDPCSLTEKNACREVFDGWDG